MNVRFSTLTKLKYERRLFNVTLVNGSNLVYLIMFLFFILWALFGGYENDMPVRTLVEKRQGTAHFENNILNNDSTLLVKSRTTARPYSVTKANAIKLRLRLQNDFKSGKITIDDVKSQFTKHLVDELIPYWYGTRWSFGGHTAMPNKGEIACGYFISTTLRDMGVRLNRYRLAQKSPIDEAKAISCGTEVLTLTANNANDALEMIDAHTQHGLYFIGFDEGHVGYLFKKNNELLLIHSNYFSPGKVCAEPLKTSRVFQSFKKFHLMDITHNEALLSKWMNNLTVL